MILRFCRVRLVFKMAEQLFITRKRKIWKFAHFDQWANCFQAESVRPEFWAKYFVTSQPLIVEVGAGTADLSVGLARQDATSNYAAIDVKSDRLYTGAKVALGEKLKNIVFVRAQLRQMNELFEPRSIAELWITFPDPFPRSRQAKHRLTHPAFLKTYQSLLVPGGVLRLKTDNRQLFLWSLEQLVAEGWCVRELSFDLHESNLPDSYKITTHFERKYMARGISINYVSAMRV
jgi:tRNA (guanine-N7-)-methyltransferase